MKTGTMKHNNSVAEISDEALHKLFIEQLKDLYDAEQQLTKAIPKLVKAAFSSELKSALEEHLQLTHEHVQRLEKIFSDLDVKASRKKCAGMAGLIKEGDEAIKEKEEEDAIHDAALIAAAQRVEHYEMAGYGTVRTFAQILGLHEAEEILQQTLNEEGEADKKLTAICENLLNR